MVEEAVRLLHKKKHLAWAWSGKVAAVLLPALVTSYYSYRSSKYETEMKAEANKARAEVVYQTLIDSVDKLSKAVEQSQKALEEERRFSAKVEGRLLAIETFVTRTQPSAHPARTTIGEGAAAAPRTGGSGSGRGSGGLGATGAIGRTSAVPTTPSRPVVKAPVFAPPAELPKNLPRTLDLAIAKQLQQQQAPANVNQQQQIQQHQPAAPPPASDR